MPTNLYKYCPARLSFFENQMIRFTPPVELNDIYDCMVSISGLFPENKTWQEIEDMIRTSTQQLPSYDAYIALERMRYFYHNRGNPSVALEIVKANEELKTKSRYIAEAAYKINSFGVLCLSEVPDSNLMWAYYADKHQGYTLELDPAHDFFHKQRFLYSDLDPVQPVRYVETRLEMATMELPDNRLEILFTKASCWQHEKEWRMILGSIDSLPLVNGLKGLVPIPNELIKSITLGANASQDLVRNAKFFCQRRNIELKKIVPDHSTFQLRIEPYN